MKLNNLSLSAQCGELAALLRSNYPAVSVTSLILCVPCKMNNRQWNLESNRGNWADDRPALVLNLDRKPLECPSSRFPPSIFIA